MEKLLEEKRYVVGRTVRLMNRIVAIDFTSGCVGWIRRTYSTHKLTVHLVLSFWNVDYKYGSRLSVRSRPLLPKSSILRLLAELVRSYHGVAPLVTGFIYQVWLRKITRSIR